MARAIVNTPVKGFTGSVVGVNFADGTADVDDEAALAYFERHGYDVIYAPETEKVVEIREGEPAEDWTKKQLEAFAEREGINLGSAKNKGEVWTAVSEAVAAKAAAE